MSEANGLILHFTRCNAPAHFERWGVWMKEIHLSDLRASEGVRAVTSWPLTQQPEPGMPSVGFSHVILIEVSGDVSRAAVALRKREQELRESGRIDASHCVINVDCLEAHGRWNRKPMPSDSLRGHILAYVMCNDPRLEQEWDRWNDEVHMPDMMDSGGFTAVSRWLRQPKNESGTNYLTLYDVGEGGVGRAVERSAAVMPGLAKAGRKMDCHVGGLTVTLGPA
jgi:hypothetical protein